MRSQLRLRSLRNGPDRLFHARQHPNEHFDTYVVSLPMEYKHEHRLEYEEIDDRDVLDDG